MGIWESGRQRGFHAWGQQRVGPMEPRGLGKENTGWSEVGSYGEGIMVA